MAAPATALQDNLGHDFADESLLAQALTHRSFLAENEAGESNERLEFLGDAVLQLAVTDYLLSAHPGLTEGEMAKIRAAIVSETILAALARRFGLGAALRLGRGEQLTGGRDKDSILADALEAVLGALYLDAGYERAKEIVLGHWRPLIGERVAAPGARDYKTRLQELLAREGDRPVYDLTESGPDHAKLFTATVRVGDAELGRGSGTSKKRAQQEAARLALLAIGADA